MCLLFVVAVWQHRLRWKSPLNPHFHTAHNACCSWKPNYVVFVKNAIAPLPPSVSDALVCWQLQKKPQT
jgi:hypothetical protein